MSVGLVIVSHSSKIAEGLVELAAQMAPDVLIVAAGGTDDGRIGTSLEKVMTALEVSESGSGVVVLCDLGSAVMTAESALEFAGNPENVVLADAPLVEGAVAAAVAAQSGDSVQNVKAAAENALNPMAAVGTPDIDDSMVTPSGAGSETTGSITTSLTLINPMGLHARPAAVLAGQLGSMDVDIEINGVDGQSVMMLMTLGAGNGTELKVSASGPDAQRAVDFVSTEVQRGFGEI